MRFVVQRWLWHLLLAGTLVAAAWLYTQSEVAPIPPTAPIPTTTATPEPTLTPTAAPRITLSMVSPTATVVPEVLPVPSPLERGELPAQFLREYPAIEQCESQGDPLKEGLLGERGRLQIHPIHTAKFEARGWTFDDAYDPEKNLVIAAEIWWWQGWAPWSYCSRLVGLR